MIHLKRSKKEITSYKMSQVRAKETGIEKIMERELRTFGLRGYQKNQKGILGTPDFCWKRKKIAVFCDSSFWHGYNWKKDKAKIKVRKKFWFKKITDNIKRDKLVTIKLKKEGWKVFRFWDFDIKMNTEDCAKKITHALKSKNKNKEVING